MLHDARDRFSENLPVMFSNMDETHTKPIRRGIPVERGLGPHRLGSRCKRQELRWIKGHTEVVLQAWHGEKTDKCTTHTYILDFSIEKSGRGYHGDWPGDFDSGVAASFHDGAPA